MQKQLSTVRSPFRLPFSLYLSSIDQRVSVIRDSRETIYRVPVTVPPLFVLAPGGPTSVHQDRRPGFVPASLKKRETEQGFSGEKARARSVSCVARPVVALRLCLSNSFSPLSSDPLLREESWKACENRRCLFSFRKKVIQQTREIRNGLEEKW